MLSLFGGTTCRYIEMCCTFTGLTNSMQVEKQFLESSVRYLRIWKPDQIGLDQDS